MSSLSNACSRLVGNYRLLWRLMPIERRAGSALTPARYKSDDADKGDKDGKKKGGRRKSYVDAHIIQGRKTPVDDAGSGKRGTTQSKASKLLHITSDKMYNVSSLREAMNLKNHEPLTSKRKALSKASPVKTLPTSKSKKNKKTDAKITQKTLNANQKSNNAELKSSLSHVADAMVKRISEEKMTPSPGPDLVNAVSAIGAPSSIPFVQRNMVANAVSKTTAKGSAASSTSGDTQKVNLEESIEASSVIQSMFETAAVEVVNLDQYYSNDNGNQSPFFFGTLQVSNLQTCAGDPSHHSTVSRESGSVSRVLLSTLDSSKRAIVRDSWMEETPVEKHRRSKFKEAPLPSMETMRPSKILLKASQAKANATALLHPLVKPKAKPLDVPMASEETGAVSNRVLKQIQVKPPFVRGSSKILERNVREKNPSVFRSNNVSNVVTNALNVSNRKLLVRDFDGTGFEGMDNFRTSTDDVPVMTREDRKLRDSVETKGGRRSSLQRAAVLAKTAKIMGDAIGEAADQGGLIAEAFEQRAVSMIQAVTAEPDEAKCYEVEDAAAAESKGDDPEDGILVDKEDMAIPKMDPAWSRPTLKDTWKQLMRRNCGLPLEFPGEAFSLSVDEPTMLDGGCGEVSDPPEEEPPSTVTSKTAFVIERGPKYVLEERFLPTSRRKLWEEVAELNGLRDEKEMGRPSYETNKKEKVEKVRKCGAYQADEGLPFSKMWSDVMMDNLARDNMVRTLALDKDGERLSDKVHDYWSEVYVNVLASLRGRPDVEEFRLAMRDGDGRRFMKRKLLSLEMPALHKVLIAFRKERPDSAGNVRKAWLDDSKVEPSGVKKSKISRGDLKFTKISSVKISAKNQREHETLAEMIERPNYWKEFLMNVLHRKKN